MPQPLGDPRQNLDLLFQLASSLVTNPVNQINRIGGTDVPVYNPNLTWTDVFQNAGYGDTASQLMALPAAVAEPGPGELRMAGDLASLIPLFARRVRKPFQVSSEAVGTIPTEQVANLPGFGGEHEVIRQTGNVMDDPRVQAVADSIQRQGFDPASPIEISVYPADHPEFPGQAFIKEGNHRAAAAQALGLEEVPTNVSFHGNAQEERTWFSDLLDAALDVMGR